MEFLEERYQSRLEELFIKFPSVQKQGFNSGAYKSGLEGMKSLDEAFGHPHTRFRTIHIAGTNGKGSVSSMLASTLAAGGMKVGLYTSPHLVDFRERVKCIGKDGYTMIPKEDVWSFLDRFDRLESDNSFFEITTAMAFDWFAAQKVDIAVIETGLGGRLDSTNIITPQLSIVTSIGLDHCALLGDSREKIAAEKAGIFKKGVPALVWGHDGITDPVFIGEARKTECPLYFADEFPPEEGLDAGMLDLKGDCQKCNLATVLAALKILGEKPDPQALMHSAERTGLWGRWQILSSKPLTICDIGHNPAALEWNFAQLDRISGKERGRLIIVYGVMADKDVDTIIGMLPSYAKYILCAPQSRRSLDTASLQEKFRTLRPDLECETAESVRLAKEKAREIAGPDSVIYIGGSAFVVAEAL